MIRNKLHLYFAALMVASVLGACNNNKGRGLNDGANIGVLPTSTCLLSPSTYQGQCNYNYAGYGFKPYNYAMGNGLNNNYATGFCGCAQGSFPVYSNFWGLGCVDQAELQWVSGGYYYPSFLMFTWNSQTLQWTPAQQNYFANNYYGYSSCLNTAILACDAASQGSCGPNATCTTINQISSGGGYTAQGPGLCVMNQNGYYTPNGY